MPIIDTFAKRMERARNAGKPVIYKYDELPEKFRGQVFYVLRDLIEEISVTGMERRTRWEEIHKTFGREIGLPDLVNEGGTSEYQCRNFILRYPDVEQILSLVEIAIRLTDAFIRNKPYVFSHINSILNSAISELNQRFQENAIGYQYQNPPGEIVRVDSQYLHAEAVEPAVSLLYDEGFTGASDEFIEAHKHYREGDNKEAISSALNAFESAMKTICDIRGWKYDAQKATASALIRTLLDNNLIPSEMQSHFTGLRTTLESGVPAIRNRFAGHGQGSEPVEVPDYLASYALHLTASNIVFLVEAHKASN